MAIRKWIEVTCDYCGDCIKHYSASDSVKEVLKKVKADGGYTKFSYTFCNEDCYKKWKEEKGLWVKF